METKNNNISRRRFITGSAALAGTAMISNPLLAVAPALKKIRMGIVGGRFGRSFQWHEHPNCIVEAVSDLRPERNKALMETYGCGKSYPSLEVLVKDKNIDAVGVFTEGPNHVCRASDTRGHA